jgi:NADH:ubiquinone oxidoreductase subunit E
MEEYPKKIRVKVCVHTTCCMNGSEKIYEKLSQELGETVDVGKTIDCFRFCKSGPNVSVNGSIMQGVRLNDAVSRVRREIAMPSRKIDAAGTKSIDELDDVLDSLFL